MISRHESTAREAPPRDEPADTPADTPPSIAAWLHALSRRMNVPASERKAVCDELDAHLRQRVQELMLCGLPEARATADAIQELGDAGQLAHRYTQAYSHPRRRRIMHIGLLGIAGAAVVAAVTTLSGPGTVIPSSAFQPPRQETPAPLRDVRVTAEASTTWGDLFTHIGASANMPVFIHWPQLRALGGGDVPAIEVHESIGVQLDSFTLDGALAMLNDHFNLSDDLGIAYRVQDNRLVIASAAFFDRHETTLVTYDLAAAIEARRRDLDEGKTHAQIAEEVVALVKSLVHPELWVDNGGDRAQLHTFGTKLFISAPARVHPKIQWVLAEMATAGQHAAQAADADEMQVRVYPLKHTAASETLRVIRMLESLQPVDFTKAAADDHTNSIIVQSAPDMLSRVGVAIDAIDQPAKEERKPVSSLDPRFQIRAAADGGLVIRASDGTELRCQELNIDPEAGIQAVPMGGLGQRVPVLGDLPILANYFTTPTRTVPLRELPR